VPRQPTRPATEPDGEADDDAATWWLYLLRSPAGRSYVGITTALDRRLAQHNGELPGGAKATRAGRPWAIERSWGPFTRSEASVYEYQLKRRPGARRSQWSP
jgi:putative endonuclease